MILLNMPISDEESGMALEARPPSSSMPRAFEDFIFAEPLVRAALRVPMFVIRTGAWAAMFASVMPLIILSTAAIWVCMLLIRAFIAGPSMVAWSAARARGARVRVRRVVNCILVVVVVGLRSCREVEIV